MYYRAASSGHDRFALPRIVPSNLHFTMPSVHVPRYPENVLERGMHSQHVVFLRH